MTVLLTWLQANWLEAAMLLSSMVAVVAAILAVWVAILALKVARRSVRSADEAHERTVRLQARTVLAEVHGSYHKLVAAYDVSQEKWRAHSLKNFPMLTSSRLDSRKEERLPPSLLMRAREELRESAESLQNIDGMALSDLEEAIPKARHAASKIDALAQRIQEPRDGFH